MKNRRIILLVLLIATGFFTCRTTANDSITTVRKVPILNNHVFIPMDAEYSPFTGTNLRMRVGIAQTERIKYLALHLGDYELLSLEGQILYSDMNLYYKQRVKNWLAMFVNFDFTARIGTEFSTLFAEGVNTVNEFSIGWLMRVYHSDKQILSAKINISNFNAKIINFKNAFDNLANDTLVAVSQEVPALLGNIGVRYFYVPVKMIGIGLLADLAYGETFVREKSSFFYTIGIKAELDLGSITSIPLGIALNYYIASPPSSIQVQNQDVQVAGFRLVYTGANDFIISIGSSWGLIPVRSSDDPLNAYFGNIELNYYF